MYYFHFIPGSRRNNHFYCFFQTRLYTGLRSISTGFSGERRHGNGEYLFQVSQFDPGIYGPGIHMRTRRLAEADCRSTEPGPFSPNSPPSLSLSPPPTTSQLGRDPPAIPQLSRTWDIFIFCLGQPSLARLLYTVLSFH